MTTAPDLSSASSPPTAPRRVVAYGRVSTHEQTNGMGLTVQREAVEAWCADRGFTLAGWHTDAGESGSNGLATRTGLARALAALKDPDVDGMVVYRLDRLARDLVLQEQLLAEIWSHGAELWSTMPAECDLRNDPDDPSRKLIRQILGAVAEYEREIITLRMKAGRRAKHEAGGFAYGRPPYGWRPERGQLVPVPAEQEVIAHIRRLVSIGGTPGGIAAALNADGVPAPRGAQWHRSAVRRILARGAAPPAK